MASPFYSGQYQYDDLSQRLASLFANITAQKKAEARQRMLDQQAAEERAKAAQRQASGDELTKFSNMLKINEMRAAEQGLAPGVQEYVGGDESPAPPAERFVETAVPEQLGGGTVKARVTSPEERQAKAAEEARKALGLKVVETQAVTKAKLDIEEPYKKADDARTAKMQADREAAIERRSEAAAGAASAKTAEKAAQRLRASYTKDIDKPRERLRAMERGLAMGNPEKPTNISDYSLVYAFAKASDPGSSVREGEFEGIQKSSAGLSGMALQYWQDIKDGKLTPQKRQDMVETIQRGLEYERKTISDLEGHYRGLADIEEVDQARIFGSPKAEAVGSVNNPIVLE